jgi:hypothetical protein
MVVPDKEGLPRNVLVPHDAVRNEVACACNRLGDGRLAVSKVDPLQVLDDLTAIENVKIEARARLGNGPVRRKVAAPPGRYRVAGLHKIIGRHTTTGATG